MVQDAPVHALCELFCEVLTFEESWQNKQILGVWETFENSTVHMPDFVVFAT